MKKFLILFLLICPLFGFADYMDHNKDGYYEVYYPDVKDTLVIDMLADNFLRSIKNFDGLEKYIVTLQNVYSSIYNKVYSQSLLDKVDLSYRYSYFSTSDKTNLRKLAIVDGLKKQIFVKYVKKYGMESIDPDFVREVYKNDPLFDIFFTNDYVHPTSFMDLDDVFIQHQFSNWVSTVLDDNYCGPSIVDGTYECGLLTSNSEEMVGWPISLTLPWYWRAIKPSYDTRISSKAKENLYIIEFYLGEELYFSLSLSDDFASWSISPEGFVFLKKGGYTYIVYKYNDLSSIGWDMWSIIPLYNSVTHWFKIGS